MADTCDLRIEQANAAIEALILSLPGGRIRPDDRPQYERLVQEWLAAVNEAREASRDMPRAA